MSNVSGINPVGVRVLIRPMELEEKTASGIVLSTGGQKERDELANTTGVLVALGPDAYHDDPTPWAKVGDKVTFGKYSGMLYMGKDGVKYRLMNDHDVTSILDDDLKLVDPWLSKGVK